MSTYIQRITGPELYDLISAEVLDTLTEAGQEIMNRSLQNSSDVWVWTVDNHIHGFWGLIPPSLLSNRAYIWLYTLPSMTEHQFAFVRHSQIAVKKLLEQYPVIVGHCAKSADKSQRWLRWLGATFGEPDGNLIPFEIKAT